MRKIFGYFLFLLKVLSLCYLVFFFGAMGYYGCPSYGTKKKGLD